jgi:outer membrane protein assembly factor BamB
MKGEKMKMQKRRLSAVIALALTLTMIAALIPILPTVSGAVTTYAQTAASPNIVQVGGTVSIIGWVTPPPAVSGAWYFNYTFTITKPDGSTLTYFFDTSDVEATRQFHFAPDTVGTWSVVLSFPGDPVGDREAATSPPYYFTVQTEAVPEVPYVPLPTGPWRYPISLENHEWYQISGDWPMSQMDPEGSNYNPYTKGPNSPHVLWKYQFSESGLLGGSAGYYGINRPFHSSATALSQGQVIVAHGKLYWSVANARSTSLISAAGETQHGIIHCMDLRTGEELWVTELPGSGAGNTLIMEIDPQTKHVYSEYTADELNVTREDFPESYGRMTLWVTGGGTWELNPVTGVVMSYYPGISGRYADSFFYVSASGNLSQLRTGTGPRQMGSGINTDAPYWTEPIGSPSLISNDGILVRRLTTSTGNPYFFKIMTYNATTGQLIVDGPDIGLYGQSAYTVGNDMLFQQFYDRRTRAISLFTGQVVWTSEPMDYPWGIFSSYIMSHDDINVYVNSYDGHVWAYDINDGSTRWAFFCGNNTQNAMQHYGTWGKIISADDKVYFATGEHTPPSPDILGNKLFCVDRNTGELVWSLNGFEADRGFTAGIAEGILFYMNQYDGCLYAIGKGESATTVSAPETTVSLGSSVLIQGTVTDQSPGTTEQGSPQAGTPAVSDESMDQWMGYLYMGKPMPLNATGVVVHLQAVGSDGTLMDITHVTSDVMGHYEYTWTPPGEDTYKIIATFEGSESYYTSAGQTGLSVGAASPTPVPPEAAPDNTFTIVGTGIAVIVAVAVVGILLLRKRP